MEMESGVTNEKSSVNADILGYLIGGLVMFVVGISVLLPSLLGYLDTMDERKSLREKAEEMGLEDIPGVNLEDTARFFLILLVMGGVLSAAGIALVTVAVIWNRGMKGSGHNPRKRPL